MAGRTNAPAGWSPRHDGRHDRGPRAKSRHVLQHSRNAHRYFLLQERAQGRVGSWEDRSSAERTLRCRTNIPTMYLRVNPAALLGDHGSAASTGSEPSQAPATVD